MYLIMQWSFDRGFLNYVNKQEQQQHVLFAKVLAKEWQHAGSWENLTNHHRRWETLLRSNFGLSFPPPPHNGRPPPRFGQAPNGPRPGDLMPPPARHFGQDYQESNRSGPNRSRPNRPGPRPPFLLAQDKSVIFGQPDQVKHLILFPITVQQNGEQKTVGFLGQLPKKQLSDRLDLAFVEQQSQAFMLVAALMVFISMLATFPIAAHLVKPIKRLIFGTQKLKEGQYDTTIKVTSKDELGQLSTNFNTLAATLKENEKTRRQWVADISHELRTPLSILKGEIEAIQDGIRPNTQEAIFSLHTEVEHLNRLVNDLYELSMSDIGALSYQKKTLNLQTLLSNTLASFEVELAQKKIELAYYAPSNLGDKDWLIEGDSTRLKQLFSNILQNTLRYTDSPGKLQVALEKTQESLTIHFKDSSPSVSEQQLTLLFERLYRVESSRNRASGGAGLGLSICQNIAHAHNGTIEAKASPIGGLWVTVTFSV